jgi:hypothetical protein
VPNVLTVNNHAVLLHTRDKVLKQVKALGFDPSVSTGALHERPYTPIFGRPFKGLGDFFFCGWSRAIVIVVIAEVMPI